ncbi:MAG: ferredoxin [Lysobacterales bacterium]|jgi:polyferredoxin|nr:MAG: ferredoxin [Xanthomonadales bacterium]
MAAPQGTVEYESIYKSEGKVYPREVSGTFQRLRTAAVFWLLGMFYLFPWLSWDGRQAVLFDLPARRFYIFGLTFWPQDFIFLALLLIMAGLALFFFTALAGRLWCGYACPQTVWTEVFLWIERLFEGDRHQRMKLDRAPWTWKKFLRKGGKHLAWVLFAAWTGFTFVGFFTPIRELGGRLFSLEWGFWESFWAVFYGFATWGNAGFLREQVCKYMCPYARFQGAMFDRDTLIIAYDPRRGEPRGPRRREIASVLERERGLLPLAAAQAAVAFHAWQTAQKGTARVTTGLADQPPPAAPKASRPEELGDCIDCTICIQVCPTGIDIRNGLQYECIACGACIDACDGVMDRLGYPRGLIRYTTQNLVEGGKTRILRPRVLIYGTLLLSLAGLWSYGVFHRSDLGLDVLRDRNALYRETLAGIENSYTLKISNRLTEPRRLRLSVEGAEGVIVVEPAEAFTVGPDRVERLPATLRAAHGTLHGVQQIRLVLTDLERPEHRAVRETRFFAPEEPLR